ncbi:MAG TPA: YIP1 family protein [Gammaproteobacteria bacterium]
MSASPTAVRGLVDIFVAPRDALQAAYDHPRRLWLPLGIVLLAMVGFWLWYYQTVDFDWLVDHFLSMSGQEMTPEQMEAARGFMSPMAMTIQTLVAVVLFTFVIYAILALYFHIVAKVSGFKDMEYGRWFSLVAWASFPAVLIVAGMVLNYGLSDSGQIPPEMLAVTNLANLLGFDASEPGWQRALASFDIIMLWEIFLMGLGVSMYMKKSLATGIVIAAIPTVLFYGISLLIAVL